MTGESPGGGGRPAGSTDRCRRADMHIDELQVRQHRLLWFALLFFLSNQNLVVYNFSCGCSGIGICYNPIHFNIYNIQIVTGMQHPLNYVITTYCSY